MISSSNDGFVSSNSIIVCNKEIRLPDNSESMMVARFEPPQQWEDWASWGLGIWLILSPWALLFWNNTPATENGVLAGFLLILIEAITLSAFRPWEEWANVAVGVWLVLSPLILPVPAVPAGANFIIVGACVILLAIYEMWDNRRQHSSGG
jgi:hypothetical protein